MLLTGVIDDAASIRSDMVTVRVAKCPVPVIAGRSAVSACSAAGGLSPATGNPSRRVGLAVCAIFIVCIVIFWISQ